jgi:uncharacterized protein
MAHPNEVLLRQAYEDFAKGDLDAAASIFADNIRWHVQGQSPISGVYVGRDEIMEFFGKIFELSGGTFRLDIHDVLANDEHVVVLVMERAERDGKVLAGTEAHVWHVSNGKVTEFWGLPADLEAAEAFWA